MLLINAPKNEENNMYGSKIGDMAWMDLTTNNAEKVKNFYQKLLGWQCEEVNMSCEEDKYVDFTMTAKQSEEKGKSSSGSFVTGVCHAKGANKDMPAVWLPYFLVANMDEAVEIVQTEGGKLVTDIKLMGNDKYVVIADPSGAQCALYQNG